MASITWDIDGLHSHFHDDLQYSHAKEVSLSMLSLHDFLFQNDSVGSQWLLNGESSRTLWGVEQDSGESSLTLQGVKFDSAGSQGDSVAES